MLSGGKTARSGLFRQKIAVPFDAHNHLHLLADRAPAAAERARAAGISGMAVNATGPEDWDAVLSLAMQCPGIVPCVGLHPWKAGKVSAGWETLLRERLEKNPSACIGEAGLDMAKDENFAEQEAALAMQLGLAANLGRPIVLHCVRAWGKLSEMLARRPLKAGFMIHSFGGSVEMIHILSKAGGCFSFTGEIADTRREKLREALSAVPRDRLLFETESPALKGNNPPFWRREPAGLPEVISAAADILKVPYGELAALSGENAKRFFGAGK